MRILYGVAGEGYGHAIRSKVIIEHLKKRHNVKIICGGKAYEALSKIWSPQKIGHFSILYDKNVKHFKTFFYNFLIFPLNLFRYLKVVRSLKKFKPELVISDFEPFSAYFSIFYRKPLISLDNIHLIIATENSFGYSLSNLISKIIIKILMPRADYYIITSFFMPKIKKKFCGKTTIVGPILRKDIKKKYKKFTRSFIVYCNNITDSDIEILKKTKEGFILYGRNKDEIDGKIRFKKFSEREFINDLKKSRGVICNGGYTAISEAVYLKKPIYSIPIKWHYEQEFNAKMIQKSGFGLCAERISYRELKEFIDNIWLYKKNYNKRNLPKKSAIKEIDRIIKLFTIKD